MSGQPTPPRLPEAFALNAPAGSGAGDKTAPFPTASQIGITPGAASLNDGFPPLTMTAPTSGGVPPSGADMNGVLYVISAWAAYLGAGQLPQYDAALQTDMGGYAIGTRLAQAADPTALWIAVTDANMTDPDTGGAGWLSSKTLYNSTAPTAGAHADNVLPGVSDYFLDYDTTAGAITLNGFVAQRTNQKIVISNIGANPLTIGHLAGTAANQVRMSSDITLLTNDSITLQYAPTINRWVQV